MVTYVAGDRATGVGRGRGGGGASRASSGGARARVRSAAASLADSEISRASAEVAFDSNDLVVVGAKLHAEAGPGVEVVGESDGSGRALVAADRPELLESAGALDGGGVVALVGVDIVGVAIGGDRTFLSSTTAWVESTEVLNDVVLNERISGPAVDGQVAVAIGLVSASVGDGPGGACRPSLASNKVALVVAPSHVEVAAVAVGVGSIALAIRREECTSANDPCH